MPTLTRKPLGQLLLTRGLEVDHLDRALAEQKRSKHKKLLGEVLIELRMCSEEQITEALAAAYGVPFARVSPSVADPKVIELLPREFLDKHAALPLFLVEGKVTVALAEPTNVFLIEEIERLAGYPAQVVAATPRDLRATLDAYVPGQNAFALHCIGGDVHPDVVSQIEQTHGASPAVKFVNFCIDAALKDAASDVHFEPGESGHRVRFRIDGRLVEKFRPPAGMHEAIAARLKELAGLDAADTQRPQDGALRVTVDNRPVNLRVTAVPGKFGEKVVLRLVDNERTSVSLERLGFGYDTLKQWRKLTALPHGLLLVTGPAGSGKTSTLYGSLREMNTAEVNVCTVEDSVAYALEGVNQFQVNEAVGFTFAAATKSLIRQDPDVILIGELRDPDAARVAAQAALAGRLVLSTLATADAPGAITRLHNLGIEPYLVGASLAGVLAQRLVRKLCQTCKEPHAPTITERRLLEKFDAPVDTLYKAKGCPRCRNLGYNGRIGVYELLTVDDVLNERISFGAPLSEIRNIARELGFKTLRADGIDKVKAGVTTMEEVFRVTA